VTAELACYVYGIVPADVEANPKARGVGDPGGRVRVIRRGEIAALVSDIARDQPLGRPDDLRAFERLLDATAAEAPVLPLRFGAVMTDPDEVAEQLLAPYHDEFRSALDELSGRTEYLVRGRYVQRALLREVLSANPGLARLRERIHGRDETATRDERMALGEGISRAIAAARDADTQTVIDLLTPLSVAVNLREPTHEEDAVHVAALIETGRRSELDEVLDDLASRWHGRVELRLLGPLAPYDFVTTRSAKG
jgi:hypothetical protein